MYAHILSPVACIDGIWSIIFMGVKYSETTHIHVCVFVSLYMYTPLYMYGILDPNTGCDHFQGKHIFNIFFFNRLIIKKFI